MLRVRVNAPQFHFPCSRVLPIRRWIGIVVRMNSQLLCVLVLGCSLAASNSFAVDDKPRPRVDQPTISPEVAADRTVTFRLKAPGAKEVKITGEKPINLQPMVRDEAGVWSIAINQMPAEIYSYSFLVDGLRIADPSNPTIKPGRNTTASLVEVPGDPPLLHEFQDVPHGTVRMV